MKQDEIDFLLKPEDIARTSLSDKALDEILSVKDELKMPTEADIEDGIMYAEFEVMPRDGLHYSLKIALAKSFMKKILIKRVKASRPELSDEDIETFVDNIVSKTQF